MPLDPGRTVSELEELHALAGGSARLAWTPAWEQARSWLTEQAASTRATMELDAAGNQWLTLGGDSAATLVIGGHLDSTPGAGLLDGPLGLLAGLEVLRRLDGAGVPPATVKLVSWADSEGARFGRSLLGSTLARWPSRHEGMDVGSLVDRDGIAFDEAAAAYGADALAGSKLARTHLRNAAACVELATATNLGLAEPGLTAPDASLGVDRCRVTWRSPAGYEAPPEGASTEAAAQLAAAVGAFAATRPSRTDAQIVEVRDAHAERLERRLVAAVDASDEIGHELGLEAAWERLWRIPPVEFDEELTGLARAAIGQDGTQSQEPESVWPSDVSELARTGVPSAMLLLATPSGTSARETVERAVLALDTLVTDVLDALASGGPPFFKIP